MLLVQREQLSLTLLKSFFKKDIFSFLQKSIFFFFAKRYLFLFYKRASFSFLQKGIFFFFTKKKEGFFCCWYKESSILFRVRGTKKPKRPDLPRKTFSLYLKKPLPYTPKKYYPYTKGYSLRTRLSEAFTEKDSYPYTPIPRRGTGYYPYTPKGYYPYTPIPRRGTGYREKLFEGIHPSRSFSGY